MWWKSCGRVYLTPRGGGLLGTKRESLKRRPELKKKELKGEKVQKVLMKERSGVYGPETVVIVRRKGA